MPTLIDRWLIAPSEGARGADVTRIRGALTSSGIAAAEIVDCANIAEALALAKEGAGEADRIVVFGSFVTVAAALRALNRRLLRQTR